MVIALDIANSFIKIMADGMSEPVYYYNTARRVKPDEELLDENKRANQPDQYKIGSPSATSWVIGEVDKGISISRRFDRDRYRSEEFKRDFLVAIAKTIGYVAQDNITVVTGLPAEHYRLEECRKDLAALMGEHTVFVNKQAKVFTIKKIFVLLQPIGTLYSMSINTRGEIVDELLVESNTLVCDIGWGTTDCVHTKNLSIRQIIPVQESMKNVYIRLKEKLEKDYPELKEVKFDIIELEWQARNREELFLGGKHYTFIHRLDEAMKETASQIIAEIKAEVKFADFDFVVFTGGGVEALKGELASQLKERNVQVADEPQMANVLGYYYYGVSKSE